jgi:epoxide hydrolase 4
MEIEHGFAEANGIRIHYAEAGSGTPILLLHGFPDFWYSWRFQMPALAAAGFRAIAPDLRGYGRTDAPHGTAAYRMDALVADGVGLMDALGLESAGVAGHDWGGVIGWYLAMYHPDRVPRLAIVNAPHPVTFARESKRPGQMLRSAYAAFFQLPAVPEAVLRAGGLALLRRAWRRGPAPEERDVERYAEAFEDPARLTAALNYYRASARHRVPRARRIGVPTMVVWGERDPFLKTSVLDGLEEWVEDLTIHRFSAGHWLQIEEPERVNDSLVGFFGHADRQDSARPPGGSDAHDQP